MHTILVEGGSTAYGLFDTERGGWAARLLTETLPYNSAHVTNPILVKNHAVMGRTLLGILKGYDNHVLPYIRLRNVGTVLSVGLNEAKILPSFGNRPRVALKQFQTQLEAYGGLAHSLGVSTVFVGLPPIDEAKNDVLGTGFFLEDEVVEAYDDVIQAHADIAGMPYIDTRRLFMQHTLSDVMYQDGRHPNPLGHAILHEAIRDALLALGALPEDYNEHRTQKEA